MAMELGAGYISKALLQNLVIPEIAKRLAGKAGEKGAKLKDIDKPEWLRKIGQWLDDHPVGTPEKVEKIINAHQEKIVRELTEHKGELSDLGQQIFDVVNELKERIDNAQLTGEDKAFLAEVKKNFDPDEFEKRLEKILKKNVDVDSQKIHDELTIFFNNMGWDDKLDVIDSKLDLVLKNISEGIEDIKGRLDRIERSKRIEIRYLPEAPPDVSDFVDRETYLDDLRNRLAKKNTIVIQGIAGIGKTQLAARLKKDIESEYVSFWKELRDVDTFDSVTRNLAGFLRKNRDSELAEYIEDGATDHDTIITMLLGSLENKNYVLFFDNYHVVENKEIHDLFKQFKDRLKGSTIVITTRNPPPFVQIDLDESNITEKGIEGFELEATKVYLEQMGVNVSEEQLTEINRRMGGHPLSLSMFVSVTKNKKGEMEAGEILNKLPKKGRLEKYLYNNIYERLNDDEQRVLEAISVFRTPVLLDACVYVAKGGNVKKTLILLEEKLLVKEKGDLYYLHDLIRDFSYNLIDDPKEYHRRAGEYYAQLEKTPENILETTYHMIKDAGVINNEVISYLIDAPEDFYTSMVVFDILLGHTDIKSNKIINLLNKLVNVDNLNVLQSFANNLGDLFSKLNKKDRKYIFELITELLKKDNPQILTGIVRSSGIILRSDPEPMLPILGKLFSEKSPLDFYIIQYIVESQHYTDETVALLKKALDRYRKKGNLSYKMALEALKRGGIEVEVEEYIIPINQLKGKTTDELIETLDRLIEEGKDVILDFSILILNQIAEESPEGTSKLLKKIVGLSNDSITRLFNIDKVLAKVIRNSPGLIEPFIYDDNIFSKFVGLRALDLIKQERPDITKEFVTPLIDDSDQLLQCMAKITLEEVEENVGEQTKPVGGIIDGIKIVSKFMKNHQMVYNALRGQVSLTEPRQFYTAIWIFEKSIEKSDPEKIVRILDALGLENPTIKNIVMWFIGTTKGHPVGMITIFDKIVLIRGTLDDKFAGISVIGELGCLAPQKACKILKRYNRDDEYSFIREFALWALIKIYDPSPEEAEKYLRDFLNDPNENLKIIADVTLNGIGIVAAA
uniref:HTH-type transcriptional regulator MalT n=1 Tax=Candidatus Methanophaga sp. ANME-1 ERB7 TaxID=2759913 RepID=A0A7G9Z7U7_9EURY|nr:HTH-type transcriptional regulator MalT [Methanosarcinales archaeon ANME-1 ERB7]